MENEFDLEHYKKINEYDVYLIDDYKFRNKSLEMQEFGAFALNLDFEIIPKNDIWISKYIQEKERDLFIENALKQLDMRMYGVERINAYDTALVLEKNLRMKINGSTKNTLKEVYSNVYHDYFWQRLKIYLVDGNVVRNLYKTDFVEGGHGYVYPWIPKNEIWVEKDMNTNEIPIIALHEYVERTIMKEQEEEYAYSHKVSSKVEYGFRPDKFKKADLANLNSSKVNELIKQFNS